MFNIHIHSPRLKQYGIDIVYTQMKIDDKLTTVLRGDLIWK